MEKEPKESREPKPQETSMILQGDPEAQLKYGAKAAKALQGVISKKEKQIIFNGKQYLELADWQTLGRFFGCSVKTEWVRETKGLEGDPGYEARVVVLQNGNEIGAAEAMCTREEQKWNARPKYEWIYGKRTLAGEEKVPSFQLKSMSQTRAASKALRNVFAWVAVLAGYADTPAEEMADVIDASGAEDEGKPKTRQDQSFMKDMRTQEIKRQILGKVNVLAKKEMSVREEIMAFVKQKTSLELVPENYNEILGRLSALVSESQGQ